MLMNTRMFGAHKTYRISFLSTRVKRVVKAKSFLWPREFFIEKLNVRIFLAKEAEYSYKIEWYFLWKFLQ